MPTKILFIRLLHRIDDDFHSTFIETRMFVEVKNIEAWFVSFEGVGYFEEEPLRVAISVDIILK